VAGQGSRAWRPVGMQSWCPLFCVHCCLRCTAPTLLLDMLCPQEAPVVWNPSTFMKPHQLS
jgi:hypothetical protein